MMSVQSFTNESLYDTWYMVGWMLLRTLSHKYKKCTETTNILKQRVLTSIVSHPCLSKGTGAIFVVIKCI